MNAERKLKQLQQILQAITKAKEEEERALANIDRYIAKKKSFITKMISYKQDYRLTHGKRLSHTVPALMLNLRHFIGKMDQSIMNEEKAIQMAGKDRAQIEKRLLKIEQKRKAIEQLCEKQEREMRITAENKSADTLDALSLR